MHNPIKHFLQNFLRCGLIGWCLEIIYTALLSLRRREYKLVGQTSLWMFPIYGMAALLEPLSHLFKDRPVGERGAVYMLLIYMGEFFTGKFLRKHEICPWDYSGSRHRIGPNIRLDYAPLWFMVGLLFEKLLNPSKLNKDRT